MPTAGVLFDLDGTLHDRAAGLTAFAADQYARLGASSKDQSRYVSRLVELDAQGRVWKDRVYAQLLGEFDLSGTPSVEQLVADYVAHFPRFAVAVDGARDALSQLRGNDLRLGVVTNGRAGIQSAVVAALNMRDLVDTVVISEEVGVRKPQRKIFEIALSHLGVLPEWAIMVGDDPVADVQGAIDAGLAAVAFRCGAVPGATAATTLSQVLDSVDAFLKDLTHFGYD